MAPQEVPAADPVEDDHIEDDPVEDNPVEDDPMEDDPVEDDPDEDDPSEDNPTAADHKGYGSRIFYAFRRWPEGCDQSPRGGWADNAQSRFEK